MKPSIRNKILLAFSGLGGALLAMTLFAWADLRFVGQQVALARAVDALREQGQEMRRHEKNALLYGSIEERAAAVGLADRLRDELALLDPDSDRWNPAHERWRGATPVSHLRDELLRYRQLVAGVDLPAAAGAGHPALRESGHRISQQLDQLGNDAARRLGEALGDAQRALLFFGLSVLAIALAVAVWLARVVARPLRALEKNLKPLAEGKFDVLPVVSRDREMLSLTDALTRMLDELERRRRRALQAEKLASLGVLATGVAHELNNPLANISAAAQILGEELASAPIEQQQWLRQIDGETLRAQKIVSRLLDFAPRRTRQSETLALAEILHSVVALLKAGYPAARAVRVEVDEGLTVVGERQAIQQIFINLIGNALGATVRGVSPRVKVAAERVTAGVAVWPPTQGAFAIGGPPSERPFVLISVSDDGEGIPVERWPRLFDPFFTTREPGKGVGLGLFIVAELVQEGGGAVAVDRAPEGGARFSVALPTEENPQ